MYIHSNIRRGERKKRKEKKLGSGPIRIFGCSPHVCMVGPRPIFFSFFQVSRDKTGKIFVLVSSPPRAPTEGFFREAGSYIQPYIHTSHVFTSTCTLYRHTTNNVSHSQSLSRPDNCSWQSLFFPCVHGPFFLGGSWNS